MPTIAGALCALPRPSPSKGLMTGLLTPAGPVHYSKLPAAAAKVAEVVGVAAAASAAALAVGRALGLNSAVGGFGTGRFRRPGWGGVDNLVYWHVARVSERARVWNGCCGPWILLALNALD